MSKGLVLPTVTPSNPLGKISPPDPATLSSVGIELLVPEGSTLLLGVTIHFGNSDFSSGQFGALKPTNYERNNSVRRGS